MMFSAPREAMTTAELPEPLDFSAYRIHNNQTKSLGDCRPGGEAFQCNLCILWFKKFSCPFVLLSFIFLFFFFFFL